ncbi:MAG: hypothetical protein JJU36_01980 [Phycisphaeraceae bacterium]|nr:hypothetical protein [Phycisphaeraceae bacterium]
MIKSRFSNRPLMAAVALVLAAGFFAQVLADADKTVTLVAYDFENEKFRAAPSEVHPDIEAGPIMQRGFFPPTNRWFDGSVAGEPGEGIADGARPGYYEITVKGLDRVGPLRELRFDLTTRRRHAGAGHAISVTTLIEGEDEGTPLKFDLVTPRDDPDVPAARGAMMIGIGEAGRALVPEHDGRSYLSQTGQSGTVIVDLSRLEQTQMRRFRIHFGHQRRTDDGDTITRSGGRSAIDNIILTATEASR